MGISTTCSSHKIRVTICKNRWNKVKIYNEKLGKVIRLVTVFGLGFGWLIMKEGTHLKFAREWFLFLMFWSGLLWHYSFILHALEDFECIKFIFRNCLPEQYSVNCKAFTFLVTLFPIFTCLDAQMLGKIISFVNHSTVVGVKLLTCWTCVNCLFRWLSTLPLQQVNEQRFT